MNKFFSFDELDDYIPIRKYQVPSMAEIKKIKKRFTVVSTFSGCGGSSLGYIMAGGNILLANEFIESAKDTYQANFPTTKIIFEDIRKISGSDILNEIKLKKYELDIFDGSPPCASFSTMGVREKHWGKEKIYSNKKQRTDDLFFEFIRVANDIQPKIIIAENVPGLLLGNARKYFIKILKNFKKIGYNCKYKILNAANYGVPQNRKRVFFICVRKDINKKITFPKPYNYVITVRDAIHDLMDTESGTSLSRYYNSIFVKLPERICAKDIEKILKRKLTGYEDVVLDRSKWLLPAKTLVSSVRVHPLKSRYLSVLECKRLQSFPDDFILLGSQSHQFERIGKSVPPLLMKAIANHVFKTILQKR